MSPRFCGGTPRRHSYSYTTEELNENLDYCDEHHEVPYERAQPGCGSQVEVIEVRATVPDRDAGRPLILKDAPLVWCPKCDGPAEVLLGRWEDEA